MCHRIEKCLQHLFSIWAAWYRDNAHVVVDSRVLSMRITAGCDNESLICEILIYATSSSSRKAFTILSVNSRKTSVIELTNLGLEIRLSHETLAHDKMYGTALSCKITKAC